LHIPRRAILQNLCHDFALPPFEDRGGKFSNGLFVEFVESMVACLQKNSSLLLKDLDLCLLSGTFI
jgi:hypothetical protein